MSVIITFSVLFDILKKKNDLFPCSCCSYEKGPLPISPYCGFETPLCHLVLYQRDRADVAHIYDSDSGDFRDELKDHDDLVIVYCEEASDELYHFILPLRAHQLSAKELKPIVFLLGHE